MAIIYILETLFEFIAICFVSGMITVTGLLLGACEIKSQYKHK